MDEKHAPKCEHQNYEWVTEHQIICMSCGMKFWSVEALNADKWPIDRSTSDEHDPV